MFNKNPYLVNPYIYNKLLNDLITEAKSANDAGDLNYYSVKLNRFKNQLLKYYIYKNDILVENVFLIAEKKPFAKKTDYLLYFDIKNNTKFVLKSLFIKIEFIVNSKTYTIEKKVISYRNPIDYYDLAKQVNVKLPAEVQFSGIKNDITAKFYAKKRDDAPWALLGIEQLNF